MTQWKPWKTVEIPDEGSLCFEVDSVLLRARITPRVAEAGGWCFNEGTSDRISKALDPTTLFKTHHEAAEEVIKRLLRATKEDSGFYDTIFVTEKWRRGTSLDLYVFVGRFVFIDDEYYLFLTSKDSTPSKLDKNIFDAIDFSRDREDTSYIEELKKTITTRLLILTNQMDEKGDFEYRKKKDSPLS